MKRLDISRRLESLLVGYRRHAPLGQSVYDVCLVAEIGLQAYEDGGYGWCLLCYFGVPLYAAVSYICSGKLWGGMEQAGDTCAIARSRDDGLVMA